MRGNSQRDKIKKCNVVRSGKATWGPQTVLFCWITKCRAEGAVTGWRGAASRALDALVMFGLSSEGIRCSKSVKVSF